MINERLKQLRTARGLSQNEMADILEVSLSSYQKYEREKNSVTTPVSRAAMSVMSIKVILAPFQKRGAA